TADQLGRPVAAELALALVDRALLRVYDDKLAPIGPFFYNQERTGAFTTESTAAFRYEPPTQPVAEAVVEEQERLAALAKDAEVLDESRRKAAEQVAQRQPAPASKPMEVNLGMTAADRSGPTAGGMGSGGAAGASAGGRMSGGMSDAAGLKSELALGESNFFANGASDAVEAKQMVDFDGARGERRLRRFVSTPEGGEVPTRERFVETAYWNPAVVTGPDGKARVSFPAPTALSEYRFTARGVTGADTLVGQTTADLAVRRDFFVDLKLPSVLTQGDTPRFVAQVHHAGLRGPLALRLTAYAGGREQVFPKTLELKADGVEEIVFEPFEVPDSDSVRLTLTAWAGAAADEMTAEVPIRPWGVQALASASGTASDDATAFVGLPPGRTYESPEMLVVVAPTIRRMLVELALGPDASTFDRSLRFCLPVPPNTLADRAGDLLAAASVLRYVRDARASEAPEAVRLTERIRGLVAELVTAQNEDGGWPWVGGGSAPQPSDRLTSARVAFALRGAWEQALMTDPATGDRAAAYLQQELAKTQPGDHETRAALLHALSVWGKATFEQANALNRSRQGLTDVGLAYLALSFAHLDRPELAGEVLDVLGPRARSEPAGPGQPPRRFWAGSNQRPWHRNPAETTALAALAYARVRPAAPELAGAIAWLEAHRTGTGWQPSKAGGPALAALAAYRGGAQEAEDRYRLVVTVNDVEVHRVDVVGAAEGRAIRVPLKALKVGDANRVRFDIEGRGTFGYAVTLTGFTRDFKPDQDTANRAFIIGRRASIAADPELDGQVLPTGFSTAINPHTFENTVGQVPLGGRARVAIDAWRYGQAGQPDWERDFLILEEHLPAGTTLVEGSVQTQASRYELADGVLTFYFTPDQYPGSIRYDVYGYLPGQYRALPPRLRSAYEPGRSHLGPAGSLAVLEPGRASTDPYKATPDELYARGKAHFDAGRLAEAVAPL
ncbi:MAG TPA: alpha-2-macroglobulin family protein, partial [Isosphaeraceae bacterium]